MIENSGRAIQDCSTLRGSLPPVDESCGEEFMTSSEVSSSEQRELSVLIADDREYFRNWLSEELKSRFPAVKEIRECSDPHGAIARAKSQKPDLIFMDIDFKQDRTINGIQAAAEIWKGEPDTAIIIISSYDDQIYLKNLRESAPDGAAYGYVLKDNVVRDLEKAIKSVLNGEGHIDSQLGSTLAKMNRRDETLTDGQYEVLVCIALGLSDRTIAKLLFLTEQSVQARLRSLYRAFNIPSKASSESPDVGVYSSRCRAVWHGIKIGLINEAELQRLAPQIQAAADRAQLTVKV